MKAPQFGFVFPNSARSRNGLGHLRKLPVHYTRAHSVSKDFFQSAISLSPLSIETTQQRYNEKFFTQMLLPRSNSLGHLLWREEKGI